MEAKAKEQEALISQTTGKSALAHVVAAAELYMKAVQEASSAAERNRLRKKCVELMAFGERLKSAKPHPVLADMKSLSLDAKPLSLNQPGMSKPLSPQDSLITTSAFAEVSSKSSSSPARPAQGRSVPKSTRELSNREKIVLLKSSKLHGCVFPPWDTAPGEDAFRLESSKNNLYE